MPNTLVLIAAVGFGLIFALFGYPIFRVLLPIYGGIVGYAVGTAIIVPDYPVAAFLFAVALAMVFASLAYFYWSFTVGVAGALLGYGLVAGSAIYLNATAPISFLIGLVGALLGFVIFITAKDLMVMVASALNGAMIVAGAAYTWLDPVSHRDSITLVVFAAVAIIGVAVQFRFFGKERKYSAEKYRKAPSGS